MVGRKKQSMKTKSPALAGQRDTTCHEERERADTDLEFSLWVSIAILTYLVSSSQPRVWCETRFSKFSPKLGLKFSSLFTSSWLVFNSCLYLVTSPCQLIFKPESSRYFHLMSMEGDIRFQWFHKCTTLGPPFFSSYFLLLLSFTRNWLTYNECFDLTPQASAGRSVDTLSGFSYYFFFSLSLSPSLWSPVA